MFKKINHYLIEHYPLLWNLRLPHVLVIILAFHLVHLGIGFTRYTEDVEYFQNPESAYFTTSFFSFSLIGIATIFILWLLRVFRNNAFKNYYPFSNKQLFVQFGLLFVVVLLNISYYYSYTIGYVWHARLANHYGTTEKDIKVYNKVIGLLEPGKEAYSFENKIGPYPFPVVKRYDDVNGIEGSYHYESADGKWFSVKTIDSLLGGFKYSYLNFQNEYKFIISQNATEANTQDDAAVPSGIDLGMLPNAAEQQMLQLKAFQELLRQPDSLKKAMQDFVSLCQKHNIKFKLDPEVWFEWVYQPPYFPIQYSIKHYDNNYNNEYADQVNPNGYFVELSKLESTLTRIKRSYEYGFDLGDFCGFLYTALVFTLLLFSFRATSRKVWLISLIGSALISMVIGAFTAAFSLALRDSGELFLFVYLVIIFGFLIGHLLCTRKNISGALLNWFLWSLPFVSLLIFGFVEIANDKGHSQGQNWLERNADYYFFLYFVVYMLVVALAIMPMYRKWQALPED